MVFSMTLNDPNPEFKVTPLYIHLYSPKTVAIIQLQQNKQQG